MSRAVKKPLRSGITLLNGKPAPMERTGALQDIQPERYPGLTPPLSKAERFDLRAKQLHAGVQFDQAGPKRICAASTPVCFEPMFEPLAHDDPRAEAFRRPSRHGNTLRYPGGRVTDMAGNLLAEAK